MSQLGSVSKNHLSIISKVCKTHRMLSVKVLIDRLGWEALSQDVVPNPRCSCCKAKGQVDFQTVFVGESREAMLGAKAIRDPKPTGRLSG